jgi:hypothetical protein
VKPPASSSAESSIISSHPRMRKPPSASRRWRLRPGCAPARNASVLGPGPAPEMIVEDPISGRRVRTLLRVSLIGDVDTPLGRHRWTCSLIIVIDMRVVQLGQWKVVGSSSSWLSARSLGGKCNGGGEGVSGWMKRRGTSGDLRPPRGPRSVDGLYLALLPMLPSCASNFCCFFGPLSTNR